MTLLLEAALGYAARGMPVYPVHWPRPTPGGASLACSCSRGLACDRPAKHPLVRYGVKEATTDADRIGGWWRRWPQANVGLATGICFDALDIDGHAGLAPPSRHISGRSYRWLVGLDQAPLAEIPAALRLLLDPHSPTTARPARPAGPDMLGHPYRPRRSRLHLSYDALHQLALDSRVRPALAWLWPVVIDGTIVVALLTVLATNRTARRAGYP